VTEACPVCDTLWRLYSVAADNHHTLVGKHNDACGKGDQRNFEILSHEITIAESALCAVRRELRRHEGARHPAARANGQQDKR
jgi:hypothetical protein